MRFLTPKEALVRLLILLLLGWVVLELSDRVAMPHENVRETDMANQFVK